MNDVGKFIDHFRKNEGAEAVFTGDCSYWFAAILYQRFIREGAKVVYHPKTNRFGTLIHGKMYDITGVIDDKRGWVPWLSITDKSARKQITDKYILM